MKKLLLFALAALAFAAPSLSAQTPTTLPVTVQFFQGTDATGYIQYSATLNVGQGLILDSTGHLVPWTPPTIPTPLAVRASTSTATATALTRTITFAQAMPSATYSISITPSTGIGALQYTYSGKTANGFTINFSLSTSASFDWTATQQTQ